MKNADLMQTFPASPETQVTLANWRKPPFNKWSFAHAREIVPSAEIGRKPDAVRSLPVKPIDLGSITVECRGQSRSFADFLDYTDTDGLVVLHKGRIVHEGYCDRMTPATPHILMSVSKSVLGLMMGILADQGLFKLQQRVTEIIPEVSGTAYAGATLRDLLDMRVGVKFDENYTATDGAIIAYRKAQGWDPILPGEEPSDLRRFFGILTVSEGQHAGSFHYVSPNTDLLGWVIERSTGCRYADLVSELLWQPMGAEYDAYITVDRLGAPRCAGGFCATTRDLARIGQLIVENGSYGGRQVVPEAWIDDILTKGSRDAWDSGDFLDYLPDLPIHYRSKWYVLNGEAPLVFGVGVHGQNVFIDRKNDIVMAKFSSQAVAMDPARIQATIAGVKAIRDFLADQPADSG